jgi:UDP-N-acetylmuramate dehydrogenase
MTLRERVPLSSLTTFHIGGEAAYVAECSRIQDIQTAIAFSRARGLSWYVLGGGSNILASDDGFSGVIVRMRLPDFSFEEINEKRVRVHVGAGVMWDMVVRAVTARGLWGLENLAGIPGTVGASPVQNIGAYGTDVSRTISEVEVLDTAANTIRTLTKDECEFGYRDSRFKHDPSLIITRVTFTLSTEGAPNISYADLVARQAQGAILDTPTNIAHSIRDIRAQKFPNLLEEGTAGSFFKNPTITPAAFATLLEKYPGMPGYESEQGIKVSLAWILDKVLELNGFTIGTVRCFERQPLVFTTDYDATCADVEVLAAYVTKLVRESTGIEIEREVRSLF